MDGRLAITTTAWAQYGSEYLGHYLGKALIKLGICSAKQARGMKFATLAKQVFDPTAVIDYVNDVLLVPTRPARRSPRASAWRTSSRSI